jgi:hypothetical protein
MRITAEQLREMLHYEPETGIFRWRKGRIAGALAGMPLNGYIRISLGEHGAEYAHRLAWLYMTGEAPAKFVDHIDCDRANNRWANLRLATPDQNRANTRRQARNSAGAKGVIPYRGGFRATIQVRGEQILLGDFNTLEEAAAAYAGAAKVAHRDFARSDDFACSN